MIPTRKNSLHAASENPVNTGTSHKIARRSLVEYVKIPMFGSRGVCTRVKRSAQFRSAWDGKQRVGKSLPLSIDVRFELDFQRDRLGAIGRDVEHRCGGLFVELDGAIFGQERDCLLLGFSQ